MTTTTTKRDLRIDVFRGLALIMIFIDHIPDIGLSKLTIRNFGFSDAAEVFVFLAGFSAVLAYSRAFDGRGFEEGARRVGQRIFQIYWRHILLLGISFALLYGAAMSFGDPAYLHNIGMWEFVFTPGATVAQSVSLVHQPNMLNILPLYIALLAWFPAVFWMLRRSHALAIGVSVAIWAAANLFAFNLPSNLEITGWMFNPFAWQLLFTVGAVLADKYGTGDWRPSETAFCAAMIYAIFAFLAMAPWTAIPGLEETRLISAGIIGFDKTYLSPWRLMHVLALACIVAYLVRPQADWLDAPVSRALAWLGRHSLEIFCLGTVLSFMGWIILRQAEAGFGAELVVVAAGIGVMTWTAWLLERRKQAQRDMANRRDGDLPVSATGLPRHSSAGRASAGQA